MNDMAPTITPKSDQLNADDLLAGPRTIRVRDVKIAAGTEQPVAIHFDGDDGKPYLPCKSMRRVMVSIWGPDASVYAGRSMTLFRDPSVTWGGMEVGGIRISHMSHLAERTMVVLTANKKTRKPFVVQPLVIAPEPVNTAPAAKGSDAARAFTDDLLAQIAAAADTDAVHDIAGSADTNRKRDRLKAKYPSMDEEIANALTARFAALKTPDAEF